MNSPEFDIAAEIAKATQAYKATLWSATCPKCGNCGHSFDKPEDPHCAKCYASMKVERVTG